ncbi:unnamed protein product [Allacma fusca]|uniref:CCHC-type domain-containing protein n=1 Tax=Allacma fusca TaxID=39272 RepID=A0A8J2P8T3_9HEXA|nr:unnamed protein product [Allacma fusca]
MEPNIPPKQMVKKMHRRLDLELRENIVDGALESIPAFQHRLDILLRRRRADKSVETKDKKANNNSSSEDEEIPTKIETEIFKKTKDKNATEEARTVKFEGKCFYCDRIGHMKKDCNNKKRDEGNSQVREEDSEQDSEEDLEEGIFNKANNQGEPETVRDMVRELFKSNQERTQHRQLYLMAPGTNQSQSATPYANIARPAYQPEN